MCFSRYINVTKLKKWQVLQLHTAAEQFVKLTEMFLGEGHERIDDDFQAEKRVQAGLFSSPSYVQAIVKVSDLLSAILQKNVLGVCIA